MLGGTEEPKDKELIPLASRAYEKGLHAASARLYAEALAKGPGLAEDRKIQHRYNAACAAALAASGRGKDGPHPGEADKIKLREQALGWLEAELALWGNMLNAGPPGMKPNIAATLDYWKKDADLAGIRDEKQLARLPEAERSAFRQLWEEVERLRIRAGGK